jgi:hypothetical protein
VYSISKKSLLVFSDGLHDFSEGCHSAVFIAFLFRVAFTDYDNSSDISLLASEQKRVNGLV